LSLENETIVRADVVEHTEGNTDAAATDLAALASPGSESGARGHGIPRNLGDLDVSWTRADCGRGKRQPGGGGAPSDPTQQVGALRGTAERRFPKRGGTGVEKSERAVVPMKSGNHTAGTRWRDGLAVARNCCEDR
jgi:hypothetical protein